jgi:sugar/nucleoside kinase (ribokinase family)
MTLLVVGSVAYDDVTTQSGRRMSAPGGSAFYFSVSSSYFTNTSLIGVVGTDYSDDDRSILLKSGVNIDGLVTEKGKTFRWKGVYDDTNFNSRETIDTQLNVLTKFNPKLNQIHKKSDFVFLANIDPKLQKNVLSQLDVRPKLIALDTMDFWIDDYKEELEAVIENVDVLFMDENEIKSFTQTNNVITAAKTVRKLGPKIIVVKKGGNGVIMFNQGDIFTVPAFPIENVVDPTGAGDCFAGGFMGYVAGCNDLSPTTFRNAIITASVMGSFAVEGFSTEKFYGITNNDIDDRFRGLSSITSFETLQNNETLPRRTSS